MSRPQNLESIRSLAEQLLWGMQQYGVSSELFGATAYVGFNMALEPKVNYFLCNGTADDVEINAAIAYVAALGGGFVHLEPRVSGGSILNYDITSTITLDHYIGLIGALGGRSTELRLANNSDCDMIGFYPTVLLASFVYVGHMTLSGNGVNQASGHGIHFEGVGETVRDSMFERLFVAGCKQSGFYTNGTWGFRITQCLSESNGLYGFHLQVATELYVDGCYSAMNTNHGYYIQGGNTMLMVNCRSDSNVQRGFFIHAHFHGLFCNLLSYDNAETAFYIRGCHDDSFTDCGVFGNEDSPNGFHFVVDGATNNTYLVLSGCWVYDCTNHGFYVQNSDDIILDGCISHDNVASGFAISSTATRVSIVGGVSKDNGAYGIDNDGISTLIKDVTLSGNVTAPISDTGTNTRLATKVFQFQHGGTVEGTVADTEFVSATASAKGWRVDAGVDWATALGQLPQELQQIVRFKIWAVALGAPIGGGGQMHLEIVMNAGADDLAFTTEPVALANFDGETTDYIATDVIHWVVDSGDDADIGSMVGGMSLEVKVIYETGADPDGATNAVFRTVEIEYV